MRPLLTAYLFFPVYYGPWEVVRYLRKLEKSQWFSPREIERIQLKKLRALVKHAYDNVPFYHEKFRELGLKPGDISNLRDLRKLPIIKKDDLRANFPNRCITRNYNIKNLSRFKSTTSGSTGKPFTRYTDIRATWFARAARHRFESWYGLYPGVRYLTLRSRAPFTRERLIFSYSPYIRERIRDIIKRRFRLTTWKIDGKNLREFLILLRRFKPKVLIGNVSLLFTLASLFKKFGISDIHPKAVVTHAETLFDFQRRLIESVFSCRVFNFYGSREIDPIAQECEEHSGLHIDAEDLIIEFVRGGENVSFGEEGEITITDLNNYAMPFIRYNIGDVGIPTGERCACGRGLPLIRELKGRLCDLIVTKDGGIVPGLFFNLPAPYIFKNYEWIRQYQIIQPSREKLLIRMVKSAEPKNEDLTYLINGVRKYLGDVEVETEFVESIPSAPSGKHRFIISHVAHELFK